MVVIMRVFSRRILTIIHLTDWLSYLLCLGPEFINCIWVPYLFINNADNGDDYEYEITRVITTTAKQSTDDYEN